MRRVLCTIIALLIAGICLNVKAQQGESTYGDAVKFDVKMKYVYSLEEAMSKAQKENKPIFFNCFADWAMPCHSMNKAVFTDKEFCDWMDKNFVCFFADVTKPENAFLVKKYNITFFAHYLVLNKDGGIIHRIVGGMQIPDFKANLSLALNPKTSLKGTEDAYNNGNRSKENLKLYLNNLLTADYKEKFQEIKVEYLNAIDTIDLLTEDNFRLLNSLIEDAGTPLFDFCVRHKTELAKNNGEDKADMMIAGFLVRYFFPYVLSNYEYNAENMFNMYQKALKANLGDKAKSEVDKYYFLAKARGEKNNDKFLALVKENGSKMDFMVRPMVEMSLKDLSDMTPDQEKNVAEFLKMRADSIKEPKTKSQYLEAMNSVDSSKGIRFEGGTFADLLKRAKAENKPIFLDCYTSWCGPCKMMSKQVFTQSAVGDFFNEHFLSMKLDMEKGEGINISKEYGVSVFPTMLYITPDGKIAHRAVGACAPGELINVAKKAYVVAGSYGPITEKYKNGDRTPDVMSQYFMIMKETGEMKNADSEAEKYFFNASTADRLSPEMWPLVTAFGKPGNKIMKYVADNGSKYVKSIDGDIYYKSLERMYFPAMLEIIKVGRESKDMTEMSATVKKFGFEKNTALYMLGDVVPMHFKKDVDGLLKYFETKVAKMDDVHGKLNMDMLWLHFITNATTSEKSKVLSYIKSELDNADTNTFQKYKALYQELDR